MSLQFDRQYRFSAGRAGATGFEVGETTVARPTALHISFNIDKADTETPNTGKISLWNLNPEHIAVLKTNDCIVTLRAGYGTQMPLIFAGTVTYAETALDNSDVQTTIEAVDGRVALRDSYISLSYSGKVNTKKVIEDIAAAMGVTLTFSYNAKFTDLPNGFPFVGPARVALDKACASSGLKWQMQNGVLQVLMRNDTMSRNVYVLSPDSGLIGIPKHIVYGKDGGNDDGQSGWEVDYLLNGVIGINDFVRLESKYAKGYFRVRSVGLNGDNLEGDWTSTAKLVEA